LQPEFPDFPWTFSSRKKLPAASVFFLVFFFFSFSFQGRTNPDQNCVNYKPELSHNYFWIDRLFQDRSKLGLLDRQWEVSTQLKKKMRTDYYENKRPRSYGIDLQNFQ